MLLTISLKKCAQCGAFRTTESFRGARGAIVRSCAGCREKYGRWGKMTDEEKLASRTAFPVAAGTDLRAELYPRSGNQKLGGIPASITGRASCPPSCSFYNRGCYAEFHPLAMHWKRVGVSPTPWKHFCQKVSELPEGQLWRHNEAGDLPGNGDRLDVAALDALVRANARAGARGFTFTHKPLRDPDERRAILRANEAGFTVNLSADSLEDADRLADLRVGPVAVVVPESMPDRGTSTPAGRRVIVCPAQTQADLTCASCRLCAHPTRKAVVAFRAHGQFHRLVTNLVRAKGAS